MGKNTTINTIGAEDANVDSANNAGEFNWYVDDTGKMKTKDHVGVVRSSSGATEHHELTGRNLTDQHPIAAISNLQGSLDGKMDIASVSVFGDSHSDVARSGLVTNSSVGPSIYLTDTVVGAPAGRYRFGGNVSWGINTAGRNIIISWRVNGVIVSALEMEAKDSGSDIRNSSYALAHIDHPGGDLVYTVEFGPESSGDVARMYSAILEQWRVS